MAPEANVGWSASFELAGRIDAGRIDAGRNDAGRITGAGLDLVDVAKLTSARARWSGRLEARLFSARERALLAADDARVSVAFGIKESVIKLLGGLPPGGGFHDIELEPTGTNWLVRLGGALAHSERVAGQTVVAGSVRPDGLPPVVWAAAIDSAGVSR